MVALKDVSAFLCSTKIFASIKARFSYLRQVRQLLLNQFSVLDWLRFSFFPTSERMISGFQLFLICLENRSVSWGSVALRV